MENIYSLFSQAEVSDPLLRSYFVVKSLHFLKESKIFPSLFPILRNQKNHEKIEKCNLEIEGFQSVILSWKNLQTCHLNM